MIDTGIPWIGQVPEGWKVVRIKDCASVLLGKMLCPNQIDPSQSYENYLCAGNLKWAGVEGVCKQMWFTPQEKKLYLLKEGDLLTMEGGSVGTSCIYNGEFSPCYIQNSVQRISASELSINKFIYYWMNVVVATGYIDSICNKATIQHYTKEKIERTPILIPPLPTQRAIATYLDGECGKIDALRTKIEAQIADLATYKKSVITAAVTGKVRLRSKVEVEKRDPKTMKPSGVEWIGDVPEGWKVISLKHLYDHSSGNAVRVGPFGSSMSASDIIDEGVWVYNQRAVLDNNFKSNNICVSKAKAKELESFAVEPGDVLITTRGTIGKIAIVPTSAPKGILHPCIIRFRVNEDKVSKFFLRFIFNDSDLIENQIKFFSNSTTIDVVYSYTLKELKLPLPPLPEQREIAAYLDEKCAAIDAAVAKCREQLADLASYKKSLIYECVTGKKEVA